MSNFHEAGNISTLHIVDITIGFCSIFYALSMNSMHDSMQFFIYFCSTPAEMHSIL